MFVMVAQMSRAALSHYYYFVPSEGGLGAQVSEGSAGGVFLDKFGDKLLMPFPTHVCCSEV
jgi:hypothetical protein